MKIDPEIREELKLVFEKRINIISHKVVVISAYSLNEAERTALSVRMPKLSENAEIKYVIDKNILAGFVIKFGSKIIDLSLLGQLKNLKHTLYEST